MSQKNNGRKAGAVLEDFVQDARKIGGKDKLNVREEGKIKIHTSSSGKSPNSSTSRKKNKRKRRGRKGKETAEKVWI